MEESRTAAATQIAAAAANAPAAHDLRKRIERGGAVRLEDVPGPGQPFFAVILRQWFPGRPIIVVTDLLKTQESFQQDLETWLGADAKPLFYPAWEVLPHETKLAHADVISERLQTLVALAAKRMPDAGCWLPET